MPQGKTDEWLTLKQVADECKVSDRTIRRWRKSRYGPPMFRIGRRYFGWPKEIQAWLEGQRQ